MVTELSSGTAMDNSTALFTAENSEKHGEWKGKPCKHLEQGIDLEKLAVQIARVSLLQCQGCSKPSKGSSASASKDKKGKLKITGKKSGSKDSSEWPRTWVCLACGHVGCGSIASSSEGMGTGHAWPHWLYQHHPYALQWGEELLCWCFPCRAYLEFRFIEPPNLEQANQQGGLVMIGPSANELMLQALKVIQEKLVKESAKYREIRLIDAVVEKKPPAEEVEEDAGILGVHAGGSRRIVKGLVNLGNTCFFNSVLQNLLAIGVLQEHFSRPAQVTEGRLTSCLRKVYAEMNSEGQEASKDSGEGYSSTGFKLYGKGKEIKVNRNGYVNPEALFAAICTEAPCFRGFHQQDSQELLLYLLDCLNTEELDARKLQSSSLISTKNGDDKTKEPVGINGVQRDNNYKFASFIDSVFGSELSSTICCSECGHSSVSFESFLDLSLAIPSRPKPQKFSSAHTWASSSGLGKQLTKAQCYKDNDNGKGNVSTSLGPLVNKSEVNTEPPLQMEDMSSSDPIKSIISEVHAITPNKSDLLEDIGWMDYLDAPVQSADVSYEGTLRAAEVMEVADQDGPSSSVFEMASIEQLSNYNSAFQNGAFINQNAAFSQAETSEKKLSATEGDFGANDGEDTMVVSDWEDHYEMGEQEEPLQMVGDSEVLLLPYKNLNAAEEQTETDEYFQRLPSISTDETLVKHSGYEALSGIDPEVIDGDFDGFAEMFNEEESFFQKVETEAGESFHLNDENILDDIWETELGITTEEGSETNKEDPDDISLPMSLDGCLTAFTRPELLSGDNAWECESCSKILNYSFKGVMDVTRHGDKEIRYKQTVISTINDTGTYEEQVHLVNGGGSISVCDGAVDTSLSKLPEKQVDLSMFESNGMCSSEDINKYHPLKGSIKSVDGHMNCYSLGLTKNEGNMCQHVARFNDMDISQPYTKQCCVLEAECSERGDIASHSCVSSSDCFSSLQDCMGTNTGTSLANDKVVIHPATCSPIGQSKQTCTVLGRESFDSKDLIYDNDKLKNGALSSFWRDMRLKGSHSKEKEKRPKRLKRNATKVLLISKAPHVLTIHLKRFEQDMLGRLSKLSGHVSFHNKLDLRPFLDSRCPDKESCVYHLIGVVEHSGTLRSGHYVAYVRGPKDENNHEAKNEDNPSQSTWYCISDSFVRKLSFSEVLQSEAYLLFYEKDGC